MSHIVDLCPNTRLDGGLRQADEVAVIWLDFMATEAALK